jgi:hypothetical protein
MPKCVVYTRPDGAVSVTRFPAEASSLSLMEEADLPPYRSDERDRWRLVDGKVIVAPVVIAAPKPMTAEETTESVETMRAAVLADIDRATAEARRQFAITTEIVSPLESAERMAYLSAQQVGAPIEARNYPMLWASVGQDVAKTGDDVADLGAVAALMARRESAWAAFEADLKQKRFAAKAAIAAATTVDEITAALGMVN